jgi:hypothetical protein
MLDGATAHDAARAIAASREETIDDLRLRHAVTWAAASRTPDAPVLASPFFAAHERPEIVGTALLFHYINRPVTVLLGDSPLPPVPARWQGAARRAAGWWFGRAIVRAKPADPPALLPAAPLPDDLRWAAASPAVADALARFVAAVEDAGAQVLPADVRACVLARLDDWHGEDPALGREWLVPLVAPLGAARQPAARLALLTALAPHQVDDGTVAAFRAHAPADAALVAVLAWASLAAARRVVRWLVPMSTSRL